MSFETPTSHTGKRNYEHSIIPQENLQALQNLFNKRFPEIIRDIKRHNITHIILTEKTARLFKFGFQQMLKSIGLDHIMIGSIAPECFTHTDTATKQQKKKKLSFLPQATSGNDYSIMIFDEHKSRGTTLRTIRDGLCSSGYNADKIVTTSLTNEDDLVDDGEMLLDSIYYEEHAPGESKERQRLFVPDSAAYHAQLSSEDDIPRYRDTIRQIADMMVKAPASVADDAGRVVFTAS